MNHDLYCKEARESCCVDCQSDYFIAAFEKVKVFFQMIFEMRKMCV